MKWDSRADDYCAGQSRPARGAWIEIGYYKHLNVIAVSRPARGAWIEIQTAKGRPIKLGSRPARGAWIEISG